MNKNTKESFFKKYREEIKEELSNNSIVLSFAITIILIGIFSIFSGPNPSLLIGIAITTLLLTIIQCFKQGNTMLNILPIFTMLIFGFFHKSIELLPIIRILLNERVCNFIIFLAFSLSFFIQSYNHIVYKHSIRTRNIEANNHKNKLLLSQLSTDKKLVTLANNIEKVAYERDVYDSYLIQSIHDLLDYINTESFVTTVKSKLIIKGYDNKKASFDMEEIEDAILSSNGVNREREILEKKNNEVSLDKTEPEVEDIPDDEEDPFDFN